MQTLGLSETTPKPTSRIRELFAPDLSTEPNALSACDTASWACFFIAGVTTIFALFFNLGALFDAAMFVLIGLGLRKTWRTAAVAGFVLYILEQVVGIAQGRYPGILTIFILVILFSGVRASFALQRMRKANQPPPLPVG